MDPFNCAKVLIDYMYIKSHKGQKGFTQNIGKKRKDLGLELDPCEHKRIDRETKSCSGELKRGVESTVNEKTS